MTSCAPIFIPFWICFWVGKVCVCALCLGGEERPKHYKTICCFDTSMPGFAPALVATSSAPNIYLTAADPTWTLLAAHSSIVCSLRDRISLCFRFICGCHWYLFTWLCVRVVFALGLLFIRSEALKSCLFIVESPFKAANYFKRLGESSAEITNW